MINYIKVRFFDYEESAFYLPWGIYSFYSKILYIKYK